MLSQISRTSKVSVPIHVYKYKLFLNSDSSLSSQLMFTGLLASHLKRMASQCRSPLNPFRVWSLTTLSSLQCVRVCMCARGPCIYTVWLCKRIYMKPVEQWSTSVTVSTCSFFSKGVVVTTDGTQFHRSLWNYCVVFSFSRFFDVPTAWVEVLCNVVDLTYSKQW